MLPFHEFDKAKWKKKLRKFVMGVVGIFVGIMVIGAVMDISERIAQKKEQPERDAKFAKQEKQINQNDEDYISWFEDHNERYHEALDNFEQNMNNPAEFENARQQLWEVLSTVNEYEFNGQSNFRDIQDDYKNAMYYVGKAAAYQYGSMDLVIFLENAKTNEQKVEEEFKEEKKYHDENQ